MDSIWGAEAGYLEVNDSIPQNLLNSRLDSLEVIGHGIDITETKRIKELIERAEEFLEMRCFTVGERSAYESCTKRIEYFAGRLAAKGAVLKALGKERSENAAWLDIEIKRLSTGGPSVVLHGNYQQLAVGLGITKWLVSISHESSYAAAIAIALGRYDKQSSLFSLK
ncbi:MAG: holo-ACP synthase [Cyanobacteria bacterium J06635_15]